MGANRMSDRPEQLRGEIEVERDQLREEVKKLRAEVEGLRGPFTCGHDPQWAGGACAVCHAEWIEKAEQYKAALHMIYKRLNDTVVEGYNVYAELNAIAIAALAEEPPKEERT